MKQSEKVQVELDQLETPEARAIYKILDLIASQLPADDPIVNDIIKPLFPMLKPLCLEIDKNPETRKKAYDFLLQLNILTSGEEYFSIESKDSD